MAEEQATTEDQGGKKKRLPKKLLIIIAIVMVVEGGLFAAGLFLFGDAKPTVQAGEVKPDPEAAERELVEVQLIGGKFQNTRQGAQAFLYDTTIYVVVERRHQEYIESEIAGNVARISGSVTEIFLRAEPAQLNEPNMMTLKRQIQSMCNDLFGDDRDDEPYVRDVVISHIVRHNTDF